MPGTLPHPAAERGPVPLSAVRPLPRVAHRGPWRRLAALHAGLRAALRALRGPSPKR